MTSPLKMQHRATTKPARPIPRPTLGAPIRHILSMRPSPKMLRLNARRLITPMQNILPRRDRPNPNLMRQTMRPNQPFPVPHPPINPAKHTPVLPAPTPVNQRRRTINNRPRQQPTPNPLIAMPDLHISDIHNPKGIANIDI